VTGLFDFSRIRHLKLFDDRKSEKRPRERERGGEREDRESGTDDFDLDEKLTFYLCEEEVEHKTFSTL
jgi:hypothetical protein